MSNLILINSKIDDLTGFISSINLTTKHIIFDFNTDTYETLKENIAKLNIATFQNIAIAEHNQNLSTYSLVKNENTNNLADLSSWTDFKNFLQSLKNSYQVNNIDFLGCNLLARPEWINVFQMLENDLQINMRGSTDITGPIIYGGNFIMESDNVDIKLLYFTEDIENWAGTFFSDYNIGVYRSRVLKKDVNGNLIWNHKDISGNNINCPYDSSGNQVQLISNASSQSAAAWGTWGRNITSRYPSNSDISSNIIAIYSSSRAFSALNTTGNVITWGESGFGGNRTVELYPSGSDLSSGVVSIFEGNSGFAAVKSNGTASVWGSSSYKVGSPTLSNISSVFINEFDGLCAIKTDGSVIAWGSVSYGGSFTTRYPPGSSLSSGVVSIAYTYGSFAALKNDGSVITWGDTSTWGGGSWATRYPADVSLNSDVLSIYSNQSAYAAIKSNGSVVTWGNTSNGGSWATRYPADSDLNSGVIAIYPGNACFAALKNDGSVVTWGNTSQGGSWATRYPADVSLNSGVAAIYSNDAAFAALKNDGSVVTWGDTSYGGSYVTKYPSEASLSSGVKAIYSNNSVFAALKNDESVVTWGDVANGGTWATRFPADESLSSGVKNIVATSAAFAAIKGYGKIITWGFNEYGGNHTHVSYGVLPSTTSLTSNVLTASATFSGFAVIKGFLEPETNLPNYNFDISYGDVTINFPAGSGQITIDLSNNIDSIVLGTPGLATDICGLSNLTVFTLEPSGTTFSNYIRMDISVNSTTSLKVYYNTGVSTTLLSDNSNNSTTPYYILDISNSSIEFYTKSFSDLILGNDFGGSGIGDPFIKPIFGQPYYLPNDQSTYLLFDNNDNLKIYTKTWFPPNVNKEMSFMRYLLFEFNLNRFCLDLETMNFVNFTTEKYNNYTLKNTSTPIINGLKIDKNIFTNFISDYYGKNYKLSKHAKQIQLNFNINNKSIILQLISDSKYQDIRNNINISFSQFNINELQSCSGAIISEKYSNSINEAKLFKKTIINIL
jgi:hypothetical protein